MRKRKHQQDVVEWLRMGGEYMTIADSMEQAVQALELASELAVRKGSSEDLTGAAHGWMRMSETIHGINTAAAMSEGSGFGAGSNTEVGFRAPSPVKIDEGQELAEKEDVD